MTTREIREKYKVRFIYNRNEIPSKEEWEGLNLYKKRVKYLLQKKRKGDAKLITDITGINQSQVERSLPAFSRKQHIRVIDILEDIVTSREVIQLKYSRPKILAD